MANTLGNYIREVWTGEVQDLAVNRLVARNITDFEMVGDGDTFHKPYHSDLSVGDYTANATSSDDGAVTATDIDTTDESLVVDQCKYASFYVDRKDEKQMFVSLEKKMKPRAAYKLADEIDSTILKEHSNAELEIDWTEFDDSKSSGRPVDLSDDAVNILDIITKGKSKLEQNGAYNEDDFFLVADTDGYYTYLEKYMATHGYKVQDETIRNGYRGKVLDVEIYASNNIDETTETVDSSDYDTFHWVMGKKGCITLKMQADAQVEENNLPQNDDGSTRLGTEYIIWNLYGYKTFNDGAREMIDILVEKK